MREVSGERILQGLPVYNCLSISPLPCCQDFYEQASFWNSWRFRQRISDEPLRNDRAKRTTPDSPDPDFYCKIGDDFLGKMKELRKESALFAKTTPVPVLRKKRGKNTRKGGVIEISKGNKKIEKHAFPYPVRIRTVRGK